MVKYSYLLDSNSINILKPKGVCAVDRRQAASEIFNIFATLTQHKLPPDVQMQSKGEGMIMHLLAGMPDGAAPGELCRSMGVSSARVAAIFAALERKGLIGRQLHMQDRRRIRVALTPAGRQHVQQKEAQVMAQMEQFLSVLDDEEIQCFIRVLHKLVAQHQRQSEEKLC